MKIINDLVVVEVPKRANEFKIDENSLYCYIGSNCAHSELLPSPCTIIGLASEIDRLQTVEIMHHALHGWFGDEPLGSEFKKFLDSHQLHTTDTTDLLFLKKVQQ